MLGVDLLLSKSNTEHRVPLSLRYNVADTPGLSRTPGVAGDRRTSRFRIRVRRSTLGTKQVLFSAGTASIDELYFDTDNKLKLAVGGAVILATDRVFRDPTAWYEEIGFDLDTTQATAANRAKIVLGFLNGAQPAYSTDSRAGLTQNTQTNINNTVVQYVGRDNGGNYLSGFIADPTLIDGTGSLDAYSDDGVCKRPGGTFGVNGFWLPLSDNSNTTAATLGKDQSGNGNNYTPAGFSVAAGNGNDCTFESPTPYFDGGTDHGTFPKLEDLANSNGTTSNGGHSVALTSNGGACKVPWYLPHGPKVYWEVEVPSNFVRAGITSFHENDVTQPLYVGHGANSYGWDGTGVWSNAVRTAYGAAVTFSSGDVMGFAWDSGAGRLYVRKNNLAWQNGADPVAGTGFFAVDTTFIKLFAVSMSGGSGTVHINHGQRALVAAPPSGYSLLQNEIWTPPTTPVKQFMDVRYRAGNAGAPAVVNDLEFAPDAHWCFSLDSGVPISKKMQLRASPGNWFSTHSNNGPSALAGLSLDSNGFTVPADENGFNEGGQTFIDVLLKKKSGVLDFFTYTGDNTANRLIPHSLGTTPSIALVKRIDAAGDWFFWQFNFAANQWITLNAPAGTNIAKTSTNSPWGPGQWDATQFMVTNNGTHNLNAAGGVYEVLLFKGSTPNCLSVIPIQGNGDVDGPYIPMATRPFFVMFWVDNGPTNIPTRAWVQSLADGPTHANPTDKAVFIGTSSLAQTVDGLDFLATGVKIRTTSAGCNTSNQNYGLLAFGDEHVITARAR